MNTANPRFVEFVLLIVAIIWGFNPVIIKIGMQHLPPETYNLARMIVASVISLVALVLSGSWRRPSRRQFWAMLRITAVGFCLFQICLIAGLQRTTAGNTSFLLCLVPVSVVLLNRFYGLESLSRAMTVGIACSISGVLLIVVGAGKEFSLAGQHLIGTLLILAAQLSYAYYMISSKELQASHSVYQITAGQMLFTSLLMLPTTFPEITTVRWLDVPAIAWGSVLFSGVLGLCVCNFLWIWGSGILGTSRVSIFNNISPVFTVISAYFILGESFGILQSLGAACVFIGVYITRRHRPQPPQHAQNPPRPQPCTAGPSSTHSTQSR